MSRLGFGCLCMGYLQSNLSHKEGGELIKLAFQMGINFFDTAQFYDTYRHIGYAVKHGCKDMVLCSKSYAFDKKGAKQALEEALIGTGKDFVDIFLLHETEGELTIKGHYEAISYYQDMKREGLIKAVGISTHHIQAVEYAANMNEIDVIETVVNNKGIGVADGGSQDMERAIEKANANNKSIIAMKVLGGGNLYMEAEDSFRYCLGLGDVDAILCGMSTRSELEANVAFFNGEDITRRFAELAKTEKKLLIESWCTACGQCVERCSVRALSIAGGELCWEAAKCARCGYCSQACGDMAIRLISS